MVKVRGFTLIEVLVVVATVAIITAIISPSLIHAKKSAMGATNIAYLRQAGVAHGMYVSDHGDALPDTRVLVDAGYLPEELLIDPLDPTPDGWMNRYRLLYTSQLASDPLPHFDSYFNVSEILGPSLIERLQERDSNFGWLVAPYMTESDNSAAHSGPYVGRYLRLRVDGSVVSREHRYVPDHMLIDGMGSGTQSHHSYFSDLDDYGTFE